MNRTSVNKQQSKLVRTKPSPHANLRTKQTVSTQHQRRHLTSTIPPKSAQRSHPIDPKPFFRYRDHTPEVTDRTFVAGTAKVIGNVKIGANSCVLDNVIIRGDNALISIGNYTNIQEGCVLHADPGHPIVIGDYVTIGHGAVIHGCKLASNTLIGMGAIVMNGAEIGYVFFSFHPIHFT